MLHVSLAGTFGRIWGLKVHFHLGIFLVTETQELEALLGTHVTLGGFPEEPNLASVTGSVLISVSVVLEMEHVVLTNHRVTSLLPYIKKQE